MRMLLALWHREVHAWGPVLFSGLSASCELPAVRESAVFQTVGIPCTHCSRISGARWGIALLGILRFICLTAM
jgi:hypothetical protein